MQAQGLARRLVLMLLFAAVALSALYLNTFGHLAPEQADTLSVAPSRPSAQDAPPKSRIPAPAPVPRACGSAAGPPVFDPQDPSLRKEFVRERRTTPLWPCSTEQHAAKLPDAPCENAIVVPTFVNHLRFIVLLLVSYQKFVVDPWFVDNIYLVISAPSDKGGLMRWLDQYNVTPPPNVKFVLADDIWNHYGVPLNYTMKTGKIGKLAYQGLKKFYGALYTNCSRILLMDSESEFVKPTSMCKVFRDYYSHPFVITSPNPDPRLHYLVPLTAYNVLGYPSTVADLPADPWNFEYYAWFLEPDILRDMIAHVERHHGRQFHEILRENDQAFEMVVYWLYIQRNPDRYPQYKFYHGTELMASFLEDNSPNGAYGMFERIMCYSSEESFAGLKKLFNFLRFRFFRVDFHPGDAFTWALRLVEEVPTLSIRVSSTGVMYNSVNLTRAAEFADVFGD